jgi:hypothetical protein
MTVALKHHDRRPDRLEHRLIANLAVRVELGAGEHVRAAVDHAHAHRAEHLACDGHEDRRQRSVAYDVASEPLFVIQIRLVSGVRAASDVLSGFRT